MSSCVISRSLSGRVKPNAAASRLSTSRAFSFLYSRSGLCVSIQLDVSGLSLLRTLQVLGYGLSPYQVFVGLPVPDHKGFLPGHEYLRDTWSRVVIGRHREPVS